MLIKQKRRTITIAALIILVTVWSGWHLLPTASKAKTIRTFSWFGSYSKYDRLAKMLREGMTEKEVRAILGEPESVHDLETGKRWLYDEVDATTGWLCLVDFALTNGTYRLQYFCNVRHIVFSTSPHREFGRPIDYGKFETTPLLAIRRDEWRKTQKPKKAD